MKIKTIILVTLTLFTLQIKGQEKINKLDLRFGTGISLLGSGDMITFNLENEVNLYLNQYFTNSFSLNFGYSNIGISESSSFIQGNVNIFISPFKNNKQFDFRVGTGLTFYNVTEVYLTNRLTENGYVDEYVHANRSSKGFNINIENTYMLTDKFSVGLKLFSQLYKNYDTNLGALIKFGLKI